MNMYELHLHQEGSEVILWLVNEIIPKTSRHARLFWGQYAS